MSHIEVHAGDFRTGKRLVLGDRVIMRSKENWLSEEAVSFSTIAVIEQVTEENSKSITSALGMGAAGVVLLGPIGLLAGLLLGGSKTNVTFLARLSDGRRFLGTAPHRVYVKILAASALQTDAGTAPYLASSGGGSA